MFNLNRVGKVAILMIPGPDTPSEGMSGTDDIYTHGERADEFPTFAIDGAVDNEEDPSRLTAFPADSEDITTTWITVSLEDSVDIRDVL